MRKMYLFALLLALSGIHDASAEPICDEKTGSDLVGANRFDEAYIVLRECESAPGISARALGQLAALYGLFGVGAFASDKEREAKVFDLTLRAAKLGERDSVEDLASVYRHGDATLGVRANVATAACLHRVAGVTPVDPHAVAQCIDGKR